MEYNISGLGFLKDSAATAELPEEFYKEYNISGRVYKYGAWIDFESLYISYGTGSTYIGMGVNDQGLIDPGTGGGGGFETYRYIDFGDVSQEVDETLYNFLMLNAEQMNYNSVFTTVSGTYKFNHNINLFEMYTLDSVFYEGSMYGSMHKAYVVVPALAYGEMVGGNDEDFTNNNLSPENLVLIGMHQNTEEEILDLQLIYANNEGIKPEYQTFTFIETQEGPLERANDLLKYATKTAVKGPNYTALNDALDRLAVAIAERTGAELPLTLEEMLEAAKEIGQAALISFTISGTTYQAEEGMTWQQWVNSDYNTNNKYRRGGGMSMYVEETAKRNYYIYDTTTNNCVLLEDIIEVNGVYNTKYVDPVGGEIN